MGMAIGLGVGPSSPAEAASCAGMSGSRTDGGGANQAASLAGAGPGIGVCLSGHASPTHPMGEAGTWNLSQLVRGTAGPDHVSLVGSTTLCRHRHCRRRMEWRYAVFAAVASTSSRAAPQPAPAPGAIGRCSMRLHDQACGYASNAPSPRRC